MYFFPYMLFCKKSFTFDFDGGNIFMLMRVNVFSRKDRIMFKQTFAAGYYYFYFTFFGGKVNFAATR